MTILIDADDVLEDLTKKWILYINEKYGTSVRYEDVTEWDMTKNYPTLTREQVYGAELEEELYDRLEPNPGAVETVKRLMDEGHEIYIVTSTPCRVIRAKFEKVILRYFPYLTWKNVIITSNKQMIRGDVLIDDGVHNLLGGDYKKILVTAPYNAGFNAEEHGMTRVKSWEEIYMEIQKR